MMPIAVMTLTNVRKKGGSEYIFYVSILVFRDTVWYCFSRYEGPEYHIRSPHGTRLIWTLDSEVAATEN